MNTIPSALRTVYTRRRYALLTLAAAALSAAGLVAATSIPGQNLQSWLFSTTAATKLLVAVSAILLGLIATVQLYAWRTFKTVRKSPTTFSAGAVASTLAATACCSPVVLPFIGIAGFGSAFLFLQQHQAAVVLASTALLLAALYYSCKAVDCEDCRVRLGTARKS